MNAPQNLNVWLTTETIRDARQDAFRLGRSWLAVLEERSGENANAFLAALAVAARLEAITAAELMGLAADFGRLPFAEASRRDTLVVRDANDRPLLIVADPFAPEVCHWGRANLGSDFDVRLAHRDVIAGYLSRQEESLRAIDNAMEGTGLLADEDEEIEVLTLERIGDDASPVVKLVNSFLYDGLKLGASDIHLKGDATGMAIKMRLDGVLVSMGAIPGRDTAEQVVSRIKVLSDLDIAERRVPQDGRFRVRTREADIDFRVSIMPSIYGEDAVLRLLDRRALTEGRENLRLSDLGLSSDAIAAFRRLVSQPYGMVLVTGPTGSGKTTTLYAAINEINTGQDSIVTIEDPVEYRLAGVLQIPVNEKKGLTFARGLRSILRHDPDKIMVGEIRDEDTAQVAVQAALTGHLVLTTVHANNVFDVLGRFLHMGVDAYSLASSLVGIWAQRLVRLNCPECSRDHQPDAQLLADSGLHPEAVGHFRFRAGAGCGHCRGTGFKGRMAVAEFLLLNDALRQMIADKTPVSVLKDAARRMDMPTLRSAALDLVARGETSLAEINRVTFADLP